MVEFTPKNGDIIEATINKEYWITCEYIGKFHDTGHVVYTKNPNPNLIPVTSIRPLVNKQQDTIKEPLVLSCLNITGRGILLVVNDEETYNIAERVWYDDVIYIIIAVECSGMGKWINTHKGLVVKKYVE